MALSHLLQQRSTSFLHRNAFKRGIIRFSSSQSIPDTESEKLSNLKKTSMARQQRAEAVESFVKKYMERNPGTYPKATLIRNEVGGSWYTVKETLESIKARLTGALQLESDHGLIDVASSLIPTASNSNLGDPPDSGADKNLAVIHQSTDGNIRHTAISSPVESSSNITVDSSANSTRNVSRNEKYASTNDRPLVNKSPTEGTLELNTGSDSLQLELENGCVLRNEVHSNMPESLGMDLLLNSAKLPDLEHDKVNGTGFGAHQKTRELTCSILNLCSDMTHKSASDRSSCGGLANLFRNNKNVEAKAESKNGQLLEGLQSDIFWLERRRNSQVNQLSSSHPFSYIKSPSTMQVNPEYENHPPEEETEISSETRSIVSKVEEPFVSTAAKKTESSGDMNTINNHASKVMNGRKNDLHTPSFMRNLEKYNEDRPKSFGIKNLIDCIKKLPQRATTKPHENTPTSKIDGSINRSLSGGTELPTSFQGVGKKGRKLSDEIENHGKHVNNGPISMSSANLDIENDTESCPEFAVPTLMKSRLYNQNELNEIKENFLPSKESDQNKAVVKFLRNMKESEIYNVFHDCGDISKVEISNIEGAFYQTANVYFKTREGLRKALEKIDSCFGTVLLIVEAADLSEDTSNRISIPSLIGDPNVPAALVKNPTRTVMISKLRHDISSSHIEAALAFCGSNITGFFFGSSSSVAFVEFETEEGKETALAKRSIDVLGKRLLISRIDIPRTTVVRISCKSIAPCYVSDLCNSVGKVRKMRIRCEGLLDVQYRVAEWPNMLNILNGLNKVQVDGRRLLAQPATLIPPEILHVLWRQPEGRKYVKTMLQKLSHRVGEQGPVRDSLESFYRDKL